MADNMDENFEEYKAQLKQVEAALLIDENNEDLQKLKQDLEEVIALSEELKNINEVEEDVPERTSTDAAIQSVPWKAGDRVQAMQQLDGLYHDAIIDMVADDGLSCTVKFDKIGSVEVVKVSSLKKMPNLPAAPGSSEHTVPAAAADKSTSKLTRDELERRREVKKKKLLKKKQRMKDFEEKRESEKQRWQSFFKKGTGKGKSKMKGLNKKSIFASREDGKGKIGVGTCGTSGNSMTSYTPASAYMYKK